MAVLFAPLLAQAQPGTLLDGGTPEAPTELARFLQTGLPDGGEYLEGQLFHTVAKGQTLGHVASAYVRYTDRYTSLELQKAIVELNALGKKGLGPGRRLSLGPARTLPLTAVTVPRTKDFEANGLYITAITAGSGRVLELVRQAKPLGVNTVVIDIKDMDGLVGFKTKVPMALKVNAAAKAPIRDLPKLINLLHQLGIHVVARQAVFHDPMVAIALPKLALQDKAGGPWLQKGKQVWADPANAEVQDYNLSLAAEVASLGVDEVQFDYIRFPAEGNVGAIAYSFDPAKTPKKEFITGFLKRASELLRPRGVLVSLDVYGVMAWDKSVDVEMTGQRLDELGRFADVISPMLYPSHFYPPFDGFERPVWEPYHFLKQGVLRTAKKVGEGGARIRPWLQAFPYQVKERYGPDYVTTQLLGSHDAGGLGYLLWSAGNNYGVGLKGVERWNAKKKAQLTSPPATSATSASSATPAPAGSR